MKWIKISHGHYKLVADTDERSEDKDFASRKPAKGHPHVIVKVPWASHEGLIRGGDAKLEEKATEEFIEERAKWTGTSAKLRKWEESRRQEFAANKPLWRKQRMKADPLLGHEIK